MERSRRKVLFLALLSAAIFYMLVTSGVNLTGYLDIHSLIGKARQTKDNIHHNLTATNGSFAECFKSPYIICNTSDEITQSLSNIVTNSTEKPLVITTLLNSKYFLSDNLFNFEGCQHRCVFKPRKHISEAAGVIVDGVSVQEHHFPATRRPDQVYIALGLESPVHYAGSLLAKDRSVFTDQINLTSTYRSDSDLPMFYSNLCLNNKPRKTRQELERLYRSKNKSIAWFVSNCNAPSRRQDYVAKLKKYIDVDIFGGCGISGYRSFEKERSLVTKTYKFFLSFENSLCTDYVTEKFFKVFSIDFYAIPVVRGGADYDKFFPPGTFINTKHFPSPRKLAAYLHNVSNDVEKYIGYLERREVYTLMKWPDYHKTRLCRFCDAVHKSRSSPPKHYDDVVSWLSKDMCHKPTDI